MQNANPLVCRVQDAEGRGPYRPGFSHVWSERETGPVTAMEAFPEVLKTCHKLIREHGGAVGCAFRNVEQAREWFTFNEILTLARYGYTLCWIQPDEILAENDEQCVIWTAKPLRSVVIHKGWVKPS